MSEPVTVFQIADDFHRWDELLALILRAFLYMGGRIEPPSSATKLTQQELRRKSVDEIGIIAGAGDRLAGCAFLSQRDDHFYLGKLAVDPALQGQGIGGKLIRWCEDHARAAGKPVLHLQTRVELASNQAAFRRMGFCEIARTAHPGYDRPTSITMRKVIV